MTLHGHWPAERPYDDEDWFSCSCGSRVLRGDSVILPDRIRVCGMCADTPTACGCCEEMVPLHALNDQGECSACEESRAEFSVEEMTHV